MWPILGHTTLETLRVIDWAVSTLNVEPEVYMGGLSMGGDIAVAAAGIDQRIKRVVAVVATPDWLRPGMEDVSQLDIILPSGEPDSYAQYFYDRLNPLTKLHSYVHAPDIYFMCGEKDTHVPPDGAFRFHLALLESYPKVADKVTVTLIPGFKHLDIQEKNLWWPNSLSLLTRT